MENAFSGLALTRGVTSSGGAVWKGKQGATLGGSASMDAPALIRTPTFDDLERRFSDFDTLGEALPHAASAASIFMMRGATLPMF
jgi:hypothetical protein